MNRQSKFMVLICSLLYFSIINNNVDSFVGINWGRIATQRILPSMVVDLLLQNGITDVKIFSASKNVLTAFIGTNLGLTVTIPNDELRNINSVYDAKQWIKTKLSPYVDLGINLRYISIGTQPFSKKNFNKLYFHAVEVLDYMQTAIDELPLRNATVKATMDHYVDVMTRVKMPSEAEFSPEVRDVMVRSIAILAKNNAPVWLDMFPIYSSKVTYNDSEFAFFDNNSTSHFIDEGYQYKNIFEVAYDMFVCALEKEGFVNIKIGVGQVGWPTDGIGGGNVKNAERFNNGLIKHALSDKGTPRRPNQPIDTYLHNLADENRLPIISGGEKGGFIRHWGIYRFDGKPKYKIDFSGKGKDIYPYSAKGVTHMPNRWCVFNRKTNDTAIISKLVLEACRIADCTCLESGGSCGNLHFYDQVSYAFNIFFQEKSQKFSDSGCDFDGFGVISPVDPSNDGCIFPVEIMSAEEKFGSAFITGNGSDTLMFTPIMMVVSMLLFIFFTYS